MEAVSPVVRRSTPRRRHTPRRRYDFALQGELGTTVSLPRLPQVFGGTRWFSLSLLGALIWLLVHLLTSSAWQVEQVRVSGASLLSEVQIRSMAQVGDRQIFFVDPSGAEALLESQAEIASARVSVSWPNVVEITVEERLPAVAWDDGGRKWWISSEGVAFMARQEIAGMVSIVSSKPVLNIDENPLTRAFNPAYLHAASALWNELGPSAPLLYDAVHGFGFEDPAGWKAYFGVDGDMREKVMLYRAVVADLQRRGRAASIVSLEHPHAVYYRVER